MKLATPSSRSRLRGGNRNPVASEHNILLTLGWYYPEIHRGVARFAREHCWHLTADFDDPVPRNWKGDGVVTLLGTQQNTWRRLRHLDVPIVDLAESRPNIALPRVTVDNAAIGRMAAEHFLERGYRRFAFVHRREMGVSRRRRDHFSAEVSRAGHHCEILSWQAERGKRPDTRERRQSWLIRRLTGMPKPLAILAMRDVEAVEVIEACLSADIAIPEQVAVLGVDNTETICDCLRVSLSSIDTDWERVGYEGAALLERLIRGDQAPTSPIYVRPSKVVSRQSTDALAVDHPEVVAALRYIHAHYSEPIGMNDVFRHVTMSRSGLEKAFREHYIRAPAEELRHIRLVQAKRMLRDTDEKILTVAKLTGFQTPHNLCRTFKHKVGITPREYRRSYSK